MEEWSCLCLSFNLSERALIARGAAVDRAYLNTHSLYLKTRASGLFELKSVMLSGGAQSRLLDIR